MLKMLTNALTVHTRSGWVPKDVLQLREICSYWYLHKVHGESCLTGRTRYRWK